MPLKKGFYAKPAGHGAKAPMSSKRKGGPGPEGYSKV